MSIFKNIFIIIFFTFFNFKSFANETVNFVDLNYLFENSNLGKTILLNLNKSHSENIKSLKLKEKDLISEENKIKKTKNIITTEEFNSQVSMLKEKINSFNKEKETLSKNINEKKIEEFKNFFDKINPIIQEYMNKESIGLLIEKKNIFIGKSSHDITIDILNMINQKFR